MLYTQLCYIFKFITRNVLNKNMSHPGLGSGKKKQTNIVIEKNTQGTVFHVYISN